ncbi:MAG TPA: hypothetical protein VNR18_13380 [Hyphomicrobiales bacterium]|nr:hypothetical protein [Hyphomicrobiales bacterium]
MGEYAAEIVAVVLFLIGQAIFMIYNWGRQTASVESLARTVSEFTADSRRRFAAQDTILQGHTEQLNRHNGRIGTLEGRLLAAKGGA